MRKIYSALDIGSSFIKLVVGEFTNGKLNILCAVKKETRGFKNNQITNPENLIRSINNALNEASTKLNFKITKVIINIPTDYNEFILTDASIPVESEDGIVDSQDILKVLQSSSYNQVRPNDELLATVPIMFKVGDNETDNPLGKRGKTLSVKSVLVTTDKKRVYDLVKLLEKCELDIVDIYPSGLVDYYNFKSSELDSKNTIMVNIGGTTTNISIFSKGIYINNITLDLGGETIDREIANNFNLRKQEAIYVKENLALPLIKDANIKEVLTVPDKDGNEITINQLELSKIVNKKLEEILKVIKNNVNHLTKKEISYIIITGGLSEFKDIAKMLKRVFGDNVRLGSINNIGARDNAYSTSLGMLKIFDSKLSLRGKEYSMLSNDMIELMTSGSSKLAEAGDTILGKVFSYFFDN